MGVDMALWKQVAAPANAIYDAVGIRITKLPIKSEAALAAIFRESGKGRGVRAGVCHGRRAQVVTEA
ncbi:MAG: hypothetical protein MUQ56_13105 [Thermoleophilia bacterium]|nr:hypothetical protein [Thermoleophilia bacterium]